MVGSGLLLLVGLVASVLVFPLGFLVVAALGGSPCRRPTATNGEIVLSHNDRSRTPGAHR